MLKKCIIRNSKIAKPTVASKYMGLKSKPHQILRVGRAIQRSTSMGCFWTTWVAHMNWPRCDRLVYYVHKREHPSRTLHTKFLPDCHACGTGGKKPNFLSSYLQAHVCYWGLWYTISNLPITRTRNKNKHVPTKLLNIGSQRLEEYLFCKLVFQFLSIEKSMKNRKKK